MNVADTTIFHRESADLCLADEDSRFNLIYHGTFKYHYGLDLVIKALAKVRHEVPGIHLSLIGTGDTREDLQRLTEELGANRPCPRPNSQRYFVRLT
jgi:glycosyltransferase involved in cell wall biosynthesis